MRAEMCGFGNHHYPGVGQMPGQVVHTVPEKGMRSGSIQEQDRYLDPREY